MDENGGGGDHGGNDRGDGNEQRHNEKYTFFDGRHDAGVYGDEVYGGPNEGDDDDVMMSTLTSVFCAMFRSSWGNARITVRSRWNHCWIILAWRWDLLGIIWEVFLNHWDHLWRHSGSSGRVCWDCVGINLGLLQGDSGLSAVRLAFLVYSRTANLQTYTLAL